MEFEDILAIIMFSNKDIKGKVATFKIKLKVYTIHLAAKKKSSVTDEGGYFIPSPDSCCSISMLPNPNEVIPYVPMHQN